MQEVECTSFIAGNLPLHVLQRQQPHCFDPICNAIVYNRPMLRSQGGCFSCAYFMFAHIFHLYLYLYNDPDVHLFSIDFPQAAVIMPWVY